MRWRTGAATAFLAVFGAVAGARAQRPWYLSDSIGGYFRRSDQVDRQFFNSADPQAPASGVNGREFVPGVVGSGAVGYRLNPHLRIEAEVNFAEYTGAGIFPQTSALGFPQLDGQAFNHTSGDKFTRVGGEVNIFYDFSRMGTVTPYLGVGGGSVSGRTEAGLFADGAASTFSTPSSSMTSGMAMAEAGLSIAVAPHLSLVPAYR